MNVLINGVSAKSGGAATYIYNLVREISRLRAPARWHFFVPSAQAQRFGDLAENVAIQATDVGLGTPLRRFLWDQVSLRRIVKKENVQVLISSSDFAMWFAPCRQILMIRNGLFFSPFYGEQILPTKSWRFQFEFRLRRWLVAVSAKCADIVMVFSEAMKNDVQRVLSLPEEKVIVNPSGVLLEKFGETEKTDHQGEANGLFRMLYVSEYSDYKNLTTLLKALACLRDQGENNFSLTSTASPQQFPDVEISTREQDQTLTSDPRLAPYLRLPGAVPYQNIEKLYGESDLFIFPSLVESFGHPLVEAMASGLPILASDLPICREICGEAAEYFNPLDAKDLADKIRALRNDAQRREKLGQLARSRAEDKFAFKDHVVRLMETIEKLTARN